MFGKQKLSRYALMLVFALMATAMSAQSISGNVKDSFGEAVIGATIMTLTVTSPSSSRREEIWLFLTLV